MSGKNPEKLCCKWPAKLFLLAWMLGGLTLSFLIGGFELFLRFPDFFGKSIMTCSLPAVTFLQNESNAIMLKSRVQGK